MTTTDEMVRSAAEKIWPSICHYLDMIGSSPCNESTKERWVDGMAYQMRTSLADALEDVERLDWLLQRYVVRTLFAETREELDRLIKAEKDFAGRDAGKESEDG